MRIHALLASAAVLALAASAAAAPIVDGALGDRAVLQRGRPIIVTGKALPGETVSANLAGKTVSAQADKAGRFRLTLPALEAGGPYRLLLDAPSGQQVIDDLLIGDVFLCSGQSNMEMTTEQSQNSFQVHGAGDPQIRLMTVPKRLAFAPQDKLDAPPAWAAATPATIGKFSAVCFYMGQSLRETTKAPIGLIHASWGGSRQSAWLSPDGLEQAGLGDPAKTLALYTRDTAAAEKAAAGQWETWWRDTSGLAQGREPWRDDTGLAWKPVPVVGPFSRWGLPEMKGYLGMVWFKTEVTLTAEQARQASVLNLGAIDDADRTWINGQPVGGTSLGRARQYRLKPGVLREGRNVILVNADNVYADGGMLGPASAMQLRLDDGTSLPLDQGWRYAPAGRSTSNAPRSPWDDINGAGTLYNGMIAPLGPVSLAGVAWYQGESDTGLPGYDRRLSAMLKDWRARFETPNLPFAIVQLSAYGATAKRPVESGWAGGRDVQRRVAEADGHAAVVVSIDHGDPLDIHPGEKQEIGRRAARAMRAVAYGETVAPSGPRIGSAARDANGGVTLTFKDVSGALAARGGAVAIGFELCGAGVCRYANGRAQGDKVVLGGDGQPVDRIRYAWADSPVVNLFDDANQPVGPFEVPVP